MPDIALSPADPATAVLALRANATVAAASIIQAKYWSPQSHAGQSSTIATALNNAQSAQNTAFPIPGL